MPTSHMLEVSAMLGDDIHYLTAIALYLHQYQYNGLDRECLLSQYRSDDAAKVDILLVINSVNKILSKIRYLGG